MQCVWMKIKLTDSISNTLLVGCVANLNIGKLVRNQPFLEIV